MRWVRHWGANIVPAVNAGVWAVVFLDDRTGPGLLVVPAVMAAVAVSMRSLGAGVLLLVVAHGVGLAAGLHYGSLDLVAGTIIVLGWAGRYGSSAWPGVCGVALCSVAVALRDGFEPRKLAVALLVFGAVWCFGRLVGRRAGAARRAVDQAEQLAGADPRVLADPVARLERRRIGERAAADLRTAVHRMLAGIDEILEEGAPTAADVRRVRAHGAHTVEELRRVLVLLRAEPTPAPTSPPPTPRRLPFDIVLATVVGVASALGLRFVDGWSTSVITPFAYAGLVGALALRSTSRLASATVLSAAMVLLFGAPPADPDALLPFAAGIAAVAWALVDRPGRATTTVAVVLTGTSILLGTRFGADGVAFVCLVLVVSLASGLAWGEPDRILTRARERSDVLRRELEAATAEAVRQERLRTARDLHDATSHAVGVMLMQVSAAEAQLPSAPDRALAALRTARGAGESAREASGLLLPPLQGAPRDAGSLRAELAALVEQWRACGMQLEARIDPPALLDPAVAITCYRIIQEGLTNCSRHAPGARVTAEVLARRDRLFVEVRDTGARTALSFPTSGQLGLAGLRERVAAGQGHFSAGPHGSGFRLTARFPLPSAARSNL